MKKMLAIFCFAVLLPCFLFSQMMDGRSRSLIRIGNTIIHIRNNFISDTGRKYFPTYIQSPFSEEVYLVTGPKLEVSIIAMDSAESFKGAGNGFLIDSSQTDKELFSLQNLQIRITQNNKQEMTWKELSSFPISYLNTSEAVVKSHNRSYSLVEDILQVNDTRLVEVRSRKNPEVILRMRFARTALPVMPFLAVMMHDSSATTSETEFIKNAVETGSKDFKSINSFYKDWPSKYGRGSTESQQYFPSSKLAFYFRKYNEQYPDASLQYALIKNDDKDTSWHTSGHLVVITKLETNTRNSLLARYKEAPRNIWQYHFYVQPAWYQTSLFYITISLFLGLLCISIAFFIFYRRRLKQEQQRSEKLQLEQRAVRSQLNPHFTFNALNSIQSLMNQGRIEEANNYFTDFSSLLRSSLHNHEKEMLPLKEDLAALEQYIKLEQLRFRFCYAINLTEDINTSIIEVPTLLLQPLVENAVKHGISGLQDKGNLTISIKKEKKNLLIQIEDNGSGFTQTEVNGYGLSLTRKRIQLLNQTLKEQKTDMLIDSRPTGTTVFLSFENWL